MPGLVLYFRVDGRFSLWDPAQHYWRKRQGDSPEPLHFAPTEPWEVVRSEDGRVICRGLIEDWVSWQQTQNPSFHLLRAALEGLSPSQDERLEPGEPQRVWLDDVRLYPTLNLPYGRTPVTLASAAMQRIVLMAYLMVWAWQEHKSAAALRQQEPEQRLVVLFDEPETHLHPQWQRRILPALLKVAAELQDHMAVQLLVSTHAPLVLASLEPLFDPGHDRLFHFELGANRQATLEALDLFKRGDVVSWLVSNVFGLEQARSLEAERAIESAERYMRGAGNENPSGLQTREEIHARLRELLGDRDPFWPRWVVTTGAT
jgi:hypothetical protein